MRRIKSVAQFKREAERAFRVANSDVAVLLEIKWVYGPVYVTWPTGLKGYTGFFSASAPGYRTRPNVPASFSLETGLSVG